MVTDLEIVEPSINVVGLSNSWGRTLSETIGEPMLAGEKRMPPFFTNTHDTWVRIFHGAFERKDNLDRVENCVDPISRVDQPQ